MTAAQLQRRRENEAYLQNANVRAALEMISRSEGTNGDYSKMVYGAVTSSPKFPQLVGQRNVSIPDLSSFPMIHVRVNNNGLMSWAAGKYQIMKDTYVWVAAKLGITDFSAHSQDLMAVELIRFRGAMNYILAGDIEGALKNSTLNLEWASIAGNNYGQGTHSIATLVGYFQSALSSGASLVNNNPASSIGLVLVGLFFFT
jgi:muramidase (phage lysozyme)